MEVDVEAHLFSRLQDGAGGAEVEDSLLTENVDVVDSEGSCRHFLCEPRKLNLQDVERGLVHRFPPEERKGEAGEAGDGFLSPCSGVLV